jgi:DNA-binding NarL/FixJ family response regulator
MAIRVLLADDHVLVRETLKVFLNREAIEVVAQASHGQEAISLAAKTQPDIAIIEISMPTMNGLDAVRELRQVSPKTRSIFLTRHAECQYVTAALQAGTRGYVLKTQTADDLLKAIHRVHGGEIYLSPGVSGALVEAVLKKSENPKEPLSPRERHVLKLIAEGKSTKEIASILCISAKTVESHRTRLMQKLDIHDVARLVRYAIRRGLVEM